MGVFDYINKKKQQHQARREAIATARHEDKKESLLKMYEQRKKLEERRAFEEAHRIEKAEIRKLKQERLNNTLGGKMAGKVVTGMKAKIKASRGKPNVFTQGAGKNVFTKTNSPFTELGKKKGKQKSIF